MKAIPGELIRTPRFDQIDAKQHLSARGTGTLKADGVSSPGSFRLSVDAQGAADINIELVAGVRGGGSAVPTGTGYRRIKKARFSGTTSDDFQLTANDLYKVGEDVSYSSAGGTRPLRYASGPFVLRMQGKHAKGPYRVAFAVTNLSAEALEFSQNPVTRGYV